MPKPFDPDELVARVKNVVQWQERLLTEAARFANADVGQMAKQITEINQCLAMDKNNLKKMIRFLISPQERQAFCN